MAVKPIMPQVTTCSGKASLGCVSHSRPSATPTKAPSCYEVSRGSEAARSVAGLDPQQLVEKGCDAPADLVADLADLLDALARGIRKLPVQVSLAGIDRARVAAAHGDDDLRLAHELIGQRLGKLLAQVEADLAHRLDDRGIDLAGRLRTGGSHVNLALSSAVQQRRRHLRAAGVVHAHEQDLGYLAQPSPPPAARAAAAYLERGHASADRRSRSRPSPTRRGLRPSASTCGARWSAGSARGR